MQKTLAVLALAALCACQNVGSAKPMNVPAATPSPDSSIHATSTSEPSLTRPTGTPPLPDPTEQQAWAGSPHGLLASAVAVVPCSNCHEQAGGMIIGTQIAWWDAAAHKYQSVADASALCKKCHQQPNSSAQPADAQAAMHTAYPCTACHDPHTTAASCTNSGCHADVRQTNDMPPATPSGGHPHLDEGPFCGGASCHPAATAAASQPRSVHGAAHMNVTCQACHAAGSIQIRSGEQGGFLDIGQPANTGGSSTPEPSFSHIVQLQVDCQRCHFSNNPWGLPLVTGNEFQK